MNLAERAILAALKISLPTATRRDKQATEDVEKKHNSRNLGRFNKDLINRSFLVKIKSVEADARAYLYAQTVPWGDDDSRLLAARRHMKFAIKMQEFGALFDTEAQVIINDWDKIVDEAKRRLGKLYNASQYPHRAVLPSRFRFHVGYVPVPTSGDLRVALDEVQLTELRARIDEDARAALAATNAEAWDRLYKKVSHMADRLSETKGRVHATVVSGLVEVCEVLPDLNFTDDPRLNKAISLVKEKLIVPVEILRNRPEVKESTAVTARKIADAMAGWMRK